VELPRTDIHHDPESTTCTSGCQLTCIGEDISEKLDYEPSQFSVERHIRSKWASKQCETVVQAPVVPHVIDKGIATTNLLAQVLISKYADHLPLYRQQQIYARAGVELPGSTLTDWVARCGVELTPLVDALRSELLAQDILHADETPVAMLDPGQKKTRRAYVWAYATPRALAVQGVVYDFQPKRSGQASRELLAGGRAASSVTMTRATKPGLHRAFARWAAGPMPDASSMSYLSATRTRLRSAPSPPSVRCTRLSVPRLTAHRNTEDRFARTRHDP
jgi:transposase